MRIDHPEGHLFDTWLIEGRDAPRPGPVVIQIHGGPHAAHGPTPWIEMLALADAGFHVLYPNPRGSSGYGEDFAKAIHGRWGEVDGSDHMRLVEWAIETGLADPERIGVMGLSGGGYMTNWLLGHQPGRFRAGVSENPVSNWVSWYGGRISRGSRTNGSLALADCQRMSILSWRHRRSCRSTATRRRYCSCSRKMICVARQSNRRRSLPFCGRAGCQRSSCATRVSPISSPALVDRIAASTDCSESSTGFAPTSQIQPH